MYVISQIGFNRRHDFYSALSEVIFSEGSQLLCLCHEDTQKPIERLILEEQPRSANREEGKVLVNNYVT